MDAQSLAEIQPLSEREFRALGTGKPGEGVIVWNKKVVLFNARIEKDNILYEKYSTNFHEKAQRRQSKSVFRIRCLLNETRFRNRREENAGRNECLHRCI